MAASDAFYNELLIEVNSIIDELGTSYEVSTPGNYNETTMQNDPPTTRTVDGLVSDQSVAIAVANMAGSGLSSDATWMGKKMLILKANSNVQETESIVVEGLTYPLTKIVPIKAADVNLLYMLDITR